MLRLAAEHADQWNGWLVHGRSHPDEVPALIAAVDAACERAGRDPATLSGPSASWSTKAPPSTGPT
jgi:alkanesulfonate monooxygenase SsuD/methylene tetrahydromethanopterin reductase-like flavin-dependent oxidoreductase (luciferase family)